MGRRTTACQRCKSIKALCTRELPCTRCRRLSLACSYDTSWGGRLTALPHVDKAGKKKAKHRKSATGCLNCRKRRKKCDEKTPTCTDCKRLGFDCNWPTSEAGESRDSHSDPNHSPPLLSGSDVLGSSPDLFQEWADVDVPDGSNLSSQLTSFSNWLSLIESDDRLETRKAAALANSTALVGLGMPCASDDELGLATFLPSTALNNLTGVTPQALKSWTIVERHLLNHFLQTVARVLAVVDDRFNPFLRVIVPMALEQPAMRHALVTLSASHLSQVYPDFQHDLFVHRSQTLQALMAELDDHREGSVWPLAAILLLCLAEVSAVNLKLSYQD